MSRRIRLFEPISLRGLTVRNRIWLPAMCQYSVAARDGVVTSWHLAHLAARAIGGFGLLHTEATAVAPEGRISAQDAGIWNDEQAQAWRAVVEAVHAQGAAIGIQLAHAGRKASVRQPWRGGESLSADEGAWQTVAPSALAFDRLEAPRALELDEIARLPGVFADAAERAVGVGFDLIQIHAAHGYLLHEFLSPLSNQRTDAYGGDLAARARLLLEVVAAVRARVGDEVPITVRISATDWANGGLSVADSTELAGLLEDAGVDLIDVSTGGNVPADIPLGPGYQVPAAAQVRTAGLPVSAVGLITRPEQAEQILVDERADVVLVGRAALDDPNWALHAADALLGARAAELWPPQLVRGRRR